MTPGMVSPASPIARAHGLMMEMGNLNARSLPVATQARKILSPVLLVRVHTGRILHDFGLHTELRVFCRSIDEFCRSIDQHHR